MCIKYCSNCSLVLCVKPEIPCFDNCVCCQNVVQAACSEQKQKAPWTAITCAGDGSISTSSSSASCQRWLLRAGRKELRGSELCRGWGAAGSHRGSWVVLGVFSVALISFAVFIFWKQGLPSCARLLRFLDQSTVFVSIPSNFRSSSMSISKGD